VLRRDGYQCVVIENGERCIGVEDLHAGHIIPKSKGGMDTMENLQTECARHNLEKGAR
jgi:5-methylcytosine-specific restriction endonuclease McrA